MVAAHVTGPVGGGRRGWPFAASADDLAGRGYTEEEWFVAGLARSYRHVTGTGRRWNGRWSAEPHAETPYLTRMLVRRPVEGARANGTVVLMWSNVSLGYEILTGETDELYDGGFVFAAIGAQRIGIHGYPGDRRGLVDWDPQRYGALTIADDGLSWDIFTDAARLLRHEGALTAGAPVERVLALGVSQSATRLATYLNAIQPLEGALDGFLLDVYFGTGSPLEPAAGAAGVARVADVNAAAAKMPAGAHLLRDDLDVPVFVVNSETESTRYVTVRQPDTDRFRCWEVAGVAHGTTVPSERIVSPWARDLGSIRHPMAPDGGTNMLSMEPVRAAALHHMQRWLTEAGAPPTATHLHLRGDPAVVERDADGIACGGVRLPDVAVPLAAHRGLGPGDELAMFGSSAAFDADELRRRYRDPAGYLECYDRALDAAVAAGVVLPRYREGLRSRAEREAAARFG